MLDRLARSTNAHDIDGLVDCFAADYRNETPGASLAGFHRTGAGPEQLAQIFTAVPDLQATVLRSAVTGDTVWSEWEMTGTRRDGTAHLMRGVILFGVDAGRASWARFYLEPVEHGGDTIDSAVKSPAAR